MKLPSVFANKIDKIIKNNEDYYHSDNEEKSISNSNVYELKNYFDKNGYAHKLVVKIKTDSGEKIERLILCKNDYVINIDNKRIYFNDIKSFEIKK